MATLNFFPWLTTNILKPQSFFALASFQLSKISIHILPLTFAGLVTKGLRYFVFFPNFDSLNILTYCIYQVPYRYSKYVTQCIFYAAEKFSAPGLLFLTLAVGFTHLNVRYCGVYYIVNGMHTLLHHAIFCHLV